MFRESLGRVRDILHDADAALEKEFSKAFAGSSSGVINALKSKGHRGLRANALLSKMGAVEAQIMAAANELLQLIFMLVNEVEFDSVNIAEADKEEYRPVIWAPAVSHSVHLDFEMKDAGGEFVAPEGALKEKGAFQYVFGDNDGSCWGQ